MKIEIRLHRTLQYGAQLRENLRLTLKCDDSSRATDNATSTDTTVSKPFVSSELLHLSFLAYLERFSSDLRLVTLAFSALINVLTYLLTYLLAPCGLRDVRMDPLHFLA